MKIRTVCCNCDFVYEYIEEKESFRCKSCGVIMHDARDELDDEDIDYVIIGYYNNE